MNFNPLEYWNDYELEVLPSFPLKDVNNIFSQKIPLTSDYKLSQDIAIEAEDWLFLRVKHNGTSWKAAFEPGVDGISGLYATPSETACCVVVKGQAYWIPINDPESFEIVPSFPVKKIIAVPKVDIMVFVDFLRLIAYNSKGKVWETESLSWDGLEITKITEDQIHGMGWDAPNNKKVEFIVNVCDGTYQGGSSPDMYD